MIRTTHIALAVAGAAVLGGGSYLVHRPAAVERGIEFNAPIIFAAQACDEAQKAHHASLAVAVVPHPGQPLDHAALERYEAAATIETIACQHLKVDLEGYDQALTNMLAAKTDKERILFYTEAKIRRQHVRDQTADIRKLYAAHTGIGRVLDNIESAIP